MLDLDIVVGLCILLISIVLHEFAHGWVANHFGDPTARLAGRLSLNPIKHIDPFGSVILPALLVLIRSPFLFGWAKPVPVNFWQLRNPKKDMIWVGLAGPAVNLALAGFCSVCLRFPLPGYVYKILGTAIFINLLLAVFNMIPIPPLDGSRLVFGLLPRRFAYYYGQMERYGILLVVVVFLYFDLFDKLVLPLVILLAGGLGVQF